jgi:hypothetical protein
LLLHGAIVSYGDLAFYPRCSDFILWTEGKIMRKIILSFFVVAVLLTLASHDGGMQRGITILEVKSEANSCKVESYSSERDQAKQIFDETAMVPAPSPTVAWCDYGIYLLEERTSFAFPMRMLPFSAHANEQFTVDFMNSFNYVHELTFIEWEADWNHDLVIWTDTTVRNLSFVNLGFNDSVENPYFFTQENLLTIYEFSYGDALVLRVAPMHYLMPVGGLIFTDANGVQRMFIAEDFQIENNYCWCFWRFVLLPTELALLSNEEREPLSFFAFAEWKWKWIY